jgi:PPOX class probable F420-dependent enzyme
VGTNQRAQIVLTDDEVTALIAGSRTMTMATVGPTGHPHLVAMWYALVDGEICFETKSKSQKVANLRRNPVISVLIEDGDAYEELRGVAIEGTGELVDDPDYLWRVGVSMWERYYGEYTDEAKPMVEFMLNKRIAVRVKVDRVRSWDHSKLGLPDTGGARGNTAAAARGGRKVI